MPSHNPPLLYQVVHHLDCRSQASVCHDLTFVESGEFGSPVYMWLVIAFIYCSIPADTRAEVMVFAVPHPIASQQFIPTSVRLLLCKVL